MSAKIRSLAVRGFRAYGGTEQVLSLPGDIAVVWGPNSKGKTSLGEAFEFLLTGCISRRELMASSQDEFADALRNAHLAGGRDVYVAASIIAPDGTQHEIKRVLTADYAKRQDCASRLEIDGAIAQEADLASLGIALSQPPLQAPVLAQHTLSHIFSVKPTDRATYFKALFEVTDLDDLRNEVASLAGELAEPDDAPLAKFDRCLEHRLLKPLLSGIQRKMPDEAGITNKLDECVKALLEDAGSPVPDTPDERHTALAGLLADMRSKSFPVRGFERAALAGWNAPGAPAWGQLRNYATEKTKVDERTRQLSALFVEALKLPGMDELAETVECPLCGTENTLTPARLQLIKQHVENTKEFQKAEREAKAVIAQLVTSANNLADGAAAAQPSFLKAAAGQRRKEGFTVARLRDLLGDEAEAVVEPWLATLRPVARLSAALRRRSAALHEQLQAIAADVGGATIKTEVIETEFDALSEQRTSFAAALDTYDTAASNLRAALNAALDEQSDTAGWQDLLDLASGPAGLLSLLIERRARATVTKELETALKQIDSAKEKVLEEKFSDYSGAIQAWWERLRPDEHTFFSAVQPRKGAKRTIDFKAGLSTTADRETAKLRDVIAIFSQSQLHCLGLALFLARAEHEGAGFVVLDDPVLSSDEDYRVHFNSTVLTELLALPMQVIVLTQDHDTWEELETRYRHAGISTAQLYIDSPAEGTIIENTSDALIAKLNRAKSLARGGHPDSRKECGIQLRDAGERFCKEMLVNELTVKNA
ncbi:AAA family ATPase [Afifella pfennigii]|uniref:AAA family ATPase n=1 Tax=Afifella pfennigii TaxID=209897 RepID=UPI0012EBFC42|nr:AAA family ATPase [Afifella pfennigii]